MSVEPEEQWGSLRDGIIVMTVRVEVLGRDLCSSSKGQESTEMITRLKRHPTSCCSVAEIMSVLFFHTMKYRYDDPRNFNNDRFGHAAPALYSMWVEAGFLKESELLSLCHVDSTLEGHQTPKQQFVDLATGSLGQGLGVACGMAYTGKYFDKSR
ncbi:Transketolase [Collichthys lucidus]|uniref:Transketolase n=1 Tax=Collichthys lucidus TaxID=240159 RepID=A0A4U5UBR1_COLLU|nr:Transketolase [Collichthys lucidus]